MQRVDARGLACPQPVVLARRAMQTGETVVITVDNITAAQNVSRMAQRAGWNVETEVSGDVYVITVVPSGEPKPIVAPASSAAELMPSGEVVVLLASDVVGSGDPDLGALLMRTFLHTLQEIEPKPQRIICMNAGVRLAVEGSPVLEDLRALSDCGTEILLCGTCLDYLGLRDRVALGTVSNMYSLAEIMLTAARLVRL
ncbi:MAG: sulfurtransferase-like selenium metabolism protein YedF [Anaerolineae bacterium]|nr:sulfurtransferase-like selenium metabolism protein YedF [Anaerolineae bacterium]